MYVICITLCEYVCVCKSILCCGVCHALAMQAHVAGVRVV